MKTNFGILDKIIIYPIFIFLLLSCNHSAKETKLIAEKRIQDSLALIREIEANEATLEKARKDSIVLIEQEKVIGDINFGISKNEFYRLKSKFEKEHKKSYPADNSVYRRVYDIYIGEYTVFQMIPEFYEGKLYKLIIMGQLTDWEDYDREVPQQVKYISDVIKLKYGEPDLKYDIEPRYKLESGYTYIVSRWDIGRKRIEIRISNKGTSYPVNVYIYLPDILSKINSLERANEKKSTEKAKDVF